MLKSSSKLGKGEVTMAAKVWRARYYNIRITRYSELLITLRRFRTAKSNRSKRAWQLVVPCNIGLVREITFKKQHHNRKQLVSRSSQRQLSPFPYLMIVFGLLGIVFFSTQALKTQALEPPKTFSFKSHSASRLISPLTLPSSKPTSISVPSQNINANIIPVGQSADGSIQTPPLFDWSTGWYNNSPEPGQLGPSVIVGHVDNYKNISVFWRLRYVVAGDRIVIGRVDGSTATFAVDSVEQFDQNNFQSKQVYGNIPYAGLRLITCGGSFDKGTGSYTQNTVVFAHLVV
jgi:sortase (surface protein transpeptidase)